MNQMSRIDFPTTRPARGGRLALWAACGAAMAAAFAAAQAAGPVASDPELVRLMQMMALLKLAMAAGGLVLVDWRLRAGAITAMTTAYVVGGALLAAGPVLIWFQQTVVAGAVVFHAGLAILVVSAWRDRDATGALLGEVLRQRGFARAGRRG